MTTRRRRFAAALALLAVVTLVMTALICRHRYTSRMLCLCTNCGREVVLVSSGFDWEATPPGPQVEYERPTALVGVLSDRDSPCSHGQLMRMRGGRSVGPEVGNFLLFTSQTIRDGFGRINSIGHGAGIHYDAFTPSLWQSDYATPGDRARVHDMHAFLLGKLASDPALRASLRACMQSGKAPTTTILELITESRSRQGTGQPQTTGTL